MGPWVRKLVSGLVCLWCAADLPAATISFQEGLSPSGSYVTGAVAISQGAPNTNQDTLQQIRVGNETTVNGRRRGLFEFNLSAIEVAAAGNPFTIDSVALVLRQTTGGRGSTTAFNLHILSNNSDFDESTVNWNNAPGGAGGVLGTLVSTATFNPVTTTPSELDQTFASTAAFQAAVANALASDANNTLRLIAALASGEGTATLNMAVFLSNEVPNQADRPELIVTYTTLEAVPTPSILPAGASLFLALLCRRRGRLVCKP